MLKPMLVRHTKSQRRNGTALLTLQPISHEHVLVQPTEAEAALYDASLREGAQIFKEARLHAHMHALRPMLEVRSRQRWRA